MEVKPGYKQTDVGIIPENWDVESFDQTLKRQNAKAFQIQTSSYQTNGLLPVVDQGQMAVVGYSDQTDRRFECPEEGVIVFGDHTCIVKFVDFDFVVGADGTQLLTAKSGNSTRFHAYALQHRGVLSTGYNRHFKFLKERPFVRPSLPEQRAIATALSDVDGLLGGLDRLIAKKRDLKQAAMQQLLTGQTRLPGFHGEWEETTLGKVGKFKNGLNKDSSAFGHGSPFVNLMDVFGVNAISSTSHLGLVASTKMDREVYDLRQGDVLFIRSSVKPSGVGLTAVVECDLTDTVYSGFLIRFRDEGALDSGFKKHCFYAESFRKKVIAASSVSANTNINQNALGALTLLLPPTKAEQTAIAEVLTEMDAELAALEQRREKTRALKQAMMQELLTGRTRLL